MSVKDNIPTIEESQKFPGHYYLMLNRDCIDHVSPQQMYAVITLFANELDRIGFKPSGVPGKDGDDCNG